MTTKNKRLQLIVNLMSGKSGGTMTVNKLWDGEGFKFQATVKTRTWTCSQRDTSDTKFEALQCIIDEMNEADAIDWETMTLKPAGSFNKPSKRD